MDGFCAWAKSSTNPQCFVPKKALCCTMFYSEIKSHMQYLFKLFIGKMNSYATQTFYIVI